MKLGEAAAAATCLFGTYGEAAELLPSGIPQVDQAIGGLIPGSTMVVGARHRVGKSSVALQAALHSPVPHSILSLEDPTELWGARALGLRAGVSALRIIRRELTEAEVTKIRAAQAELDVHPLQIRMAVGLRGEALADLIDEVADRGARVVHVDYAQKWGYGQEPRHTIVQTLRTAQAACARRRLALIVYSQLTPRQDRDGQEIMEPEEGWMRECTDLAREARVVVLYWVEGSYVWGKISSCTYGDVAGRRWQLRRTEAGELVPAHEELFS